MQYFFSAFNAIDIANSSFKYSKSEFSISKTSVLICGKVLTKVCCFFFLLFRLQTCPAP